MRGLMADLKKAMESKGFIYVKGKFYTEKELRAIIVAEQEVMRETTEQLMVVDKARGVRVEVLSIKPKKRRR